MNRGHLTPRRPLPLIQKSQILHYGVILLKFETERFHMFLNNNRDQNLLLGSPCPPPSPVKKVKFIYGAILLKFPLFLFLMF